MLVDGLDFYFSHNILYMYKIFLLHIQIKSKINTFIMS